MLQLKIYVELTELERRLLRKLKILFDVKIVKTKPEKDVKYVEILHDEKSGEVWANFNPDILDELREKFPKESKMISLARTINNNKTEWCIEKIKKEIEYFESNNISKPKISFLGLTFKPNIDDIRESPAINVVETFLSFYPKDKIIIVEPNLTKFKGIVLSSLSDSILNSDLIFVLVAHKEFLNNQELKLKLSLSFVNLD